MPAIDDTPDYVNFYSRFGVDLRLGSSESQGIGDCPVCGKEGKFHVNVSTGQFSCKSCNFGGAKGGGNVYTFIEHIHKVCKTPATEGEALRKNRKLLDVKTLEKWGVVMNPLTREWNVPAYNTSGDLRNIYRYATGVSGKRVLYAAPVVQQQMFGRQLWDDKKGEVWISESWSAMALWETLQYAKKGSAISEGALQVTGTPTLALGLGINVLGVPGAGVWNDTKDQGWAKLCAGKKVVLCYDNDHPRKVNGSDKVVDGGGLSGMKRVAGILLNSETPPESVSYVKWGKEDDTDPNRKNGWDARDQLTEASDKLGRVKALQELMGLVKPVPETWNVNKSLRAHGGVKELKPVKCESWEKLIDSWEKSMHMHEGLERGLAVCLAVAMSTVLSEDQLWTKLIGPPSCGKTKICDALLVCGKYTELVSTLTGFHSGYKSDKEGKENHSLIHKLRGKCMITKDADPLIKNPDREKILGELRDIYDGTSSARFKHGVDRNETGIYLSSILAGTETLRDLDESDAGQRYLDCVILSDVTYDLERAIGHSIWKRAKASQGTEKTSEAESIDSPEMIRTKQLTGGYLYYLRENAPALQAKIHNPDELEQTFFNLARFISFMRARPSDMKEEYVQREMCGRLMNQLIKMATCLACVLQRKTVDKEVMRIIRRIAFDTARGNTLRIVDKIMESDVEEGVTDESLQIATAMRPATLGVLTQYLQSHKVLERYRPRLEDGTVSKAAKRRWRVTPTFQDLYNSVRGRG